MPRQHESHKNPGLRRSQAVSTFGPGAIVDLRYLSVMMGGQDFWPENAIEIHEPNLERLLKVDSFRMPAISGGDDLPAILFPEWLVCPNCNRLAPYRFFTQGEPVRTDRKIKCPRCSVPVYPARLITACEHGHIDDFPWSSWVHLRDIRKADRENSGMVSASVTVETEEASTSCRKPELYLSAQGKSSSLGDLMVCCRSCGARAPLSGATLPENLRFLRCRGRRIWLADTVECGAEVFPLQRGASNVYFPIPASSISIPPWSERVYVALDRHWGLIQKISSADTLADIVHDNGYQHSLGMSVPEVVQAIQFRKMEESHKDVELTERDIRLLECRAIRRGSGKEEPGSEFHATSIDVPERLKGLLSDVVLVERLREVRALRGFTRVSPPDPGKGSQVDAAPISKHKMNWLPGIEIRGEGVYLELNETALSAWAGQEDVCARAQQLHHNYEQMCAAREWVPSRQITPRLVLVHSLAHILIRQMGLESGYSSASLRERLYVFSPEELDSSSGIAGLLIYTSTTDSEGSLGGLVRQGKQPRLQNTVLAALQEAAWCASDPLCIESQGQGRDALNMAACHACLLVSETSCEEFNVYLDRGFLVGTLDAPHVGFFNQLLS